MAASLVRTIANTLVKRSANQSLKLSLRHVHAQPIMAFTEAGIIPDILRDAPMQHCKVTYPSGAEVAMGNTLTPTQVKDQPTLAWEQMKSDLGALYTVILTDPDAPSRDDPKWAEWHHWLMVNVPLIGVFPEGEADISKADVLSEYVGSGPPEGTGLHRYVFLVFKQKGKIVDTEHGHITNRSGEGRNNFNTKKFLAKHGLDRPVAGNFYYAEFDDYVPQLYKQLGAA